MARYMERNFEYVETELNPAALILQCTQNPTKGRIQMHLGTLLEETPGWTSSTDAIIRLPSGVTKAPDVCLWLQSPSQDQLDHSLGNNCPPPHLWIEVARPGGDCTYALEKLRDHVIPGIGATCACLLIAIPNRRTPAMMARVGMAVAPPFLPEVPAAAVAAHVAPLRPVGLVSDRRPLTPALAYWAPGTAFAAGQWYSVRANQHIDIALPAAPPGIAAGVYRLECNIFLRCLQRA